MFGESTQSTQGASWVFCLVSQCVFCVTHVVTKSDSARHHSGCLDNFSSRDLENIQHTGIRGVPHLKGQWENQTESSVTFFLGIFHLQPDVF